MVLFLRRIMDTAIVKEMKEMNKNLKQLYLEIHEIRKELKYGRKKLTTDSTGSESSTATD